MDLANLKVGTIREPGTVGVKSMSPVDIELLFVILYNITALHHNTNLFSLEIT